MRKLIYTLAAIGFAVLLNACTKEAAEKVTTQKREFPYLVPMPPKIKLLPEYFPVCIYSFDQLVSLLGNNTVEVTRVVLEDDTVIPVGGVVLSITYYAVNTGEPNALFRSQLAVRYDLYGYPQSHFSDVWSLGCMFIQNGVPPFTNILKGRLMLEINTCIIWSVLPHVGKRIKYIVVE